MVKVCTAMVLLFLVGCTTLSKPDEDSITRPFTDADAKRPITIATNRSFDIGLQANPTTGYEWSLSIEPQGIIGIKSKTFSADSSRRVGVGGTMIWTMGSKKVGTARLTFRYHRPWEKRTDPTRVVTFEINVR